MSKFEYNHKSNLDKYISEGRLPKISRFLLNCLGGTPIIGGVFGATASVLDGLKQDEINNEMSALLKIQNREIVELDNKIVLLNDEKLWMVSYIKFKTNNVVDIVDSSNVSSVIDNGQLDFTICFHEPQPEESYLMQYYGSEKIDVSVKEQNKDCIRVVFYEPCPELVTLLFVKIL